jgi:hypothetical protein
MRRNCNTGAIETAITPKKIVGPLTMLRRPKAVVVLKWATTNTLTTNNIRSAIVASQVRLADNARE